MIWWQRSHKSKLVVDHMVLPSSLYFDRTTKTSGGIQYLTSITKDAFHVYWSNSDDTIYSIDLIYHSCEGWLCKEHSYVGIPLDKLGSVTMVQLLAVVPEQIAGPVIAAFNVQRMQLG